MESRIERLTSNVNIARVLLVVGTSSSSGIVKPTTIILVFAHSPLRTQHYCERAKTGSLGI